MVEHKFNEPNGIVNIKVAGEHNVKDLISAISFNPDYVKSLNALKICEDARAAKVKLDEDSLPSIVGKLVEKSASFSEIYHAVIHSNPQYIHFTKLVRSLLSGTNYHIEIFPSIDEATVWLKNQ